MAQGSDFVFVERMEALAASTIENVPSSARAFFKEWIGEAIKQIGPSKAWYSGPVVLYPTDYMFRKPVDMYDPIDIALFDSSHNELKYAFRGFAKRIHASDNNLINTGQYVPEQGAPIDLSEDAYYFHLGTNGAAVDYAVLKYWKMPVDDTGELLMTESNTFAIMMFIHYMMALRSGNHIDKGQARNAWLSARNEARSENKTPSMLEMDEIARSWNSMIKKMRFKQF